MFIIFSDDAVQQVDSMKSFLCGTREQSRCRQFFILTQFQFCLVTIALCLIFRRSSSGGVAKFDVAPNRNIRDITNGVATHQG